MIKFMSMRFGFNFELSALKRLIFLAFLKLTENKYVNLIKQAFLVKTGSIDKKDEIFHEIDVLT